MDGPSSSWHSIDGAGVWMGGWMGEWVGGLLQLTGRFPAWSTPPTRNLILLYSRVHHTYLHTLEAHLDQLTCTTLHYTTYRKTRKHGKVECHPKDAL